MYSLLEAANKGSPTAPATGLSPVARVNLPEGFDVGVGNSITAGCFLGAAAAAANTTSSTGVIPPLVLLTGTSGDTAVPVATATTSGNDLLEVRQARLDVVGRSPRKRAHPGIGQTAAEPHRNKAKGVPQRTPASRRRTNNNAASQGQQQHQQQPTFGVRGSGNLNDFDDVSRMEKLR